MRLRLYRAIVAGVRRRRVTAKLPDPGIQCARGEAMAKKTVAIVGSYRKGGTVDQLVDAVLEGANEAGAQTKKIFLIDHKIEYCRNCRQCTQAEGEAQGKCAIEDDMAGVLAELESADALVLASPVNFYNVTAIFR